MQFLKTIFWVLVAVVIALFAKANWSPVTLKLWNDIVADVQLPLLLLAAFAVGWLPTWLIMRARLWSMQRRLDALDRQALPGVPPASVADDQEPVI